MNFRNWTLGFFALAACVAAAGCCAKTEPAAKETVAAAESPAADAQALERRIDPKADEALKAMSEFLGKQQTLEFLYRDTYDRPDETGQLIQYSHERKLTIARPNRMRIDVQGDLSNEQILFDGKEIIAYKKKENVYAKDAIAGTIDEMLDQARAKYQIEFPAAEIARADIYSKISKTAVRIIYVGQHYAGSVLCDHILVAGPNVEGQLWIEQGATPYPRKIVIIYRERPGTPRYTMTVESVKSPVNVSDDFFAFAPPANCEEIPFHPMAKQKADNGHAK